MVHPERFERPTPRFVAWGKPMGKKDFPANQHKIRTFYINTLAIWLQTDPQRNTSNRRIVAMARHPRSHGNSQASSSNKSN